MRVLNDQEAFLKLSTTYIDAIMAGRSEVIISVQWLAEILYRFDPEDNRPHTFTGYADDRDVQPEVIVCNSCTVFQRANMPMCADCGSVFAEGCEHA